MLDTASQAQDNATTGTIAQIRQAQSQGQASLRPQTFDPPQRDV